MDGMNDHIVDIKSNKSIEYNSIIEAVYSILLLCDYDILSPYYNNYQQEVRNYLTSHVSKDDIDFFSNLSRDRFRFVIPCFFALSLISENGVLKINNPINSYYVNRLGGEKIIHDCIYHLNCFFNDTNYLDFFFKHREMYNNYLMGFKELLYKIMNDVQTWYDCQDIHFTAYISQLIHPGGFGVSLSPDHAKCVVGSLLQKDGSIEISLSLNVYFHEFSHHFVDQYVENNWNSIKVLFENIIYVILMIDIVNRNSSVKQSFALYQIITVIKII